MIPAILWWKLMQKEIEQAIKSDRHNRTQEMDKVKNVAFHRA